MTYSRIHFFHFHISCILLQCQRNWPPIVWMSTTLQYHFKSERKKLPSKRPLKREFEISKDVIWKIWEKLDFILKQSALLSKKLSIIPWELQLDNFPNLKICWTCGLKTYVVSSSLYRHLLALRKWKVLFIPFAFANTNNVLFIHYLFSI